MWSNMINAVDSLSRLGGHIRAVYTRQSKFLPPYILRKNKYELNKPSQYSIS